MKNVTLRATLAIDGLGWLAINEFTMLRTLPYCVGVENYRERKTFFRSYASGILVFQVPDYFAEEFRQLYNNVEPGVMSLYDQLPKQIPTIVEMRIQKILDDKEYVKDMKRKYLYFRRLGYLKNLANQIVETKYGCVPGADLEALVFDKIGWFEKLLLRFGK
jgi:hypothetical protein